MKRKNNYWGEYHCLSTGINLLKISKPKKLLLQWHITNLCNLRCQHCYQDEHNNNSDVSKDELLIILNQYIQLLKKWNIKGHITLQEVNH